ncbi:helix-turn-helix domain-containing protein [Paucibacter sp. O1-1]|uniref:helix-turn-helix domain-containing protein n=1 Tax=Aquabacterium sp. OR-4 TaxID=2978127 RepID=UPI0021D5007C|nr:helix-turn-helix domain-containing protein [Aquabacterium sp. OR-4]MCU7370252.1 helix-turn-helix domain-containing protein [Paucibacter sp. O1-1]MDA3825237.1 helix-turn-helix domain-containing protein [Paucibacter sp. O1-1]MDT7836478.1 helix-turn-helix domain-containing protein [Aquabacterium sp. OR-4]
MQKQTALRLLGGSPALVAREVGVSVQAVNQWPDPLPARIADRVLAALARKHLPTNILAELESMVDQQSTGGGAAGASTPHAIGTPGAQLEVVRDAA